jgi:hypothetical protein
LGRNNSAAIGMHCSGNDPAESKAEAPGHRIGQVVVNVFGDVESAAAEGERMVLCQISGTCRGVF